jgi:hypothetical protein
MTEIAPIQRIPRRLMAERASPSRNPDTSLKRRVLRLLSPA